MGIGDGSGSIVVTVITLKTTFSGSFLTVIYFYNNNEEQKDPYL